MRTPRFRCISAPYIIKTNIESLVLSVRIQNPQTGLVVKSNLTTAASERAEAASTSGPVLGCSEHIKRMRREIRRKYLENHFQNNIILKDVTAATVENDKLTLDLVSSSKIPYTTTTTTNLRPCSSIDERYYL